MLTQEGDVVARFHFYSPKQGKEFSNELFMLQHVLIFSAIIVFSSFFHFFISYSNS